MEREAKTIDELRQIYQDADKKIIKILDYAILLHGGDSLGVFVIGTPSKSKKSICYKESKEHGFKDFEVYPAIVKRSPSQGVFLNLVVEIKDE